MAGSGLLLHSLCDIAAAIRRRQVSPVEVTRAALDRLEHLTPCLNAVLTNLGEHAWAAAKRSMRLRVPCASLSGASRSRSI
jgi:aspartyl-tRNA(Asn)/glutamyl-tRNA(Gln) amidotransferase subunit A